MEGLETALAANLGACKKLHYLRQLCEKSRLSGDYMEHLEDSLEFHREAMRVIETHLALMKTKED